ncbi:MULTISPECIES: LysR substrate-binding domain-containing protein [unclassified Rhizobium]|jgi:LysR family glycine cleavage system transcriptional activator|uniref:LysR substrate-binding domain-containing protein n=1 Tax=unclassified Rhizobium TaxID=2613769 RepID=UPI0006480D20|nr:MULTISPECIES: LysR substrate-binding domain-containing protein [unclassified Rhizobium]MBN8949041.1 LysR family transcriptional regulator [Rhizobium tropici]OJY61849.1 MAG: LysR family transcriptional regulator [Rhizobium sp. 60-20]RKD35592.1 DNA-binding transcriptional LysR family regulator [Rhizobium sp. WW_1]
MRFRRRLPSLTGLLMLEAVLRRKSFTAAAEELGVTQAAVSRQIALLEDELGQAMFLRKHRAIEPTAACLTLGSSLAQSLANIADTIEAIKASSEAVVTIGATVAFSSFWLLPRLADFRSRNPGIQIRVISQDAKIDLDSGEVDIVIRYGLPPFSDGTVIASRGDVIMPVCSPDYLKRRAAGPLSAKDDFIETDAADRSWFSWTQWLSRSGATFEARASLRFNHYTETIFAARAGQGVALGWGVLVQTFLDDGTLVPCDDSQLIEEARYNVLLPLKARRAVASDQAAAWLTAMLHG